MVVKALAVDIGASSGRIIEGIMKNDILNIQEIHRFENKMIEKEDNKGDKEYCWELDRLFNEIVSGLEKNSGKVSNEGLSPASLGIDTWGVDFVLIDSEGLILGESVSYRSHRTDGIMEEVFKKVSREEIYKRTGIQLMQINTIYQLYAVKQEHPEYFREAASFLMIPDYLNFLLTGKFSNEYTEATTTQLLNVENKNWDSFILSELNIPTDIFQEPIEPGTILGEMKKELQEKTGLKELKVIVPATHDTGSAVAAVPASESDYAYISSGTWSLMGIETNEPICTESALKCNFTNEGGVYGRNRFLKNIMGLWLIQRVKKELDNKYAYTQLVDLARLEDPFRSLINPEDPRFLNPVSMIDSIQEFCRETEQYIPEKPGQIARCIFESLAFQYNLVLEELTEVTGKELSHIHIIGGGVQNEFLNQLTADITGVKVYAGPIEATAIGNLLVQFITLGYINSLEEGRVLVRNSFDIKEYIPGFIKSDIQKAWHKFMEIHLFSIES